MLVLFSKHIHAKFSAWSSLDIQLVKELDIPFLPSVGMEMSHGDWSAIITRLWWNADTAELTAFTDADMELYNAELNKCQPERAMLEIVTGYLQGGWELAPRSCERYAALTAEESEVD